VEPDGGEEVVAELVVERDTGEGSLRAGLAGQLAEAAP
jgi:hypothetical protein